MCALAHYFEVEGVPTTLVALIREHAEAIRPPRALWTPFELGRPVGAPEDPAFQRRVVSAALALLERDAGPVLEDFDEEAPADAGAAADDEGWACPVSFAQPAANTPTTFAGRIAAEIGQLRPWHETWKSRRGASGVGASGLEVEAAAGFIGAIADGGEVVSPIEGVTAGDALKLVVGDLMTFYQEAANAQPGAAGGSQEISDWFWGETAAGEALLEVRRVAGENGDKRVAFVAQRLILPHVAARLAK